MARTRFPRIYIFTFLVFAGVGMYSLFNKNIREGPENDHTTRPHLRLTFGEHKKELEFIVNEDSISTKNKDLIKVEELEMVTTLVQNDSRILRYIQKQHLLPPSVEEYNLLNPKTDGGLQIGLIPIIKKLLKNKKNGFFIEAGSNDGERYSSTLGFERFDSWTGLCVEPSPAMQTMWKGKHRKAWLANVCLSPKPYPLWTSFLHRDDYTLSSKIGDPDILDDADADGTWTVYRVPCFPIFSLLSALNVTEVDYFNLDVEGVELEVLKTIPFKDILIRTISVEIHSISLPALKAVTDFMSEQGYTTVHAMTKIDNADYIFAHPSILQ